jgi:hypothetical protein
MFIDDDMLFSPESARQLVMVCRETESIVGGLYPFRNAAGWAVQPLAGTEIKLGDPVTEVEYAASGFMAIHRKVVRALVKTLPLAHADQPTSFWPMFMPFLMERPDGVIWELSDDWSFCQRARDAGFTIWLDPSILVGHLGQVTVTAENIKTVYKAIQEAGTVF